MSDKLINGKKPLSAKVGPTINSSDEPVLGNALTLSPAIKKELAEQGLVGRWVDAKRLYEHQGYHPNGWRPYKRKTSATMDSVEFAMGNDPSGIIRRGSCILAVKSDAEVKAHRAALDRKAAQKLGGIKNSVKELQSMGRSLGAKIHEGYEDDGSED